MSSSDNRDLYAVLGVDPAASAEQITHAYRALLRRHHPDTRTNPSTDHIDADDARLQLVLAAYAVLRDPARRADYDRNHQAAAPPQRERRPERRTPPAPYPTLVVLGTVEHHRPPWVSPVPITPTSTIRSNGLTPTDLRELLRDLLD